MKNDTLKLICQVPNFSLVLCSFDAFQQGEGSMVRRIIESRHSLIDLKFVERLHAQILSLIHYIGTVLIGFRPTCLDSFACAFASLSWCECGGSCRTAFFPAFAP